MSERAERLDRMLAPTGPAFASRTGNDMDENRYYFAGDPEKDSPRRHMQRVLSETPAPSRHWWILGALAGGSSWTVWRLLRRRRDEAERSHQ